MYVCHIFVVCHLPSTKTPVLDPHQSSINIHGSVMGEFITSEKSQSSSTPWTNSDWIGEMNSDQHGSTTLWTNSDRTFSTASHGNETTPILQPRKRIPCFSHETPNKTNISFHKKVSHFSFVHPIPFHQPKNVVVFFSIDHSQ